MRTKRFRALKLTASETVFQHVCVSASLAPRGSALLFWLFCSRRPVGDVRANLAAARMLERPTGTLLQQAAPMQLIFYKRQFFGASDLYALSTAMRSLISFNSASE